MPPVGVNTHSALTDDFKESDCWGSRRVCVRICSCVPVICRDGRRPRQLGSFPPVICAVWSLGLLRRLWLLRGGYWGCAGCLGNVWGIACVRPCEVAQTYPSSGSVALRFGARAHRSDADVARDDSIRRAYISGARARDNACVGGGLLGWAGGVVEAGKQARRTWTNRLTTACSGLSLRGDGPLVVIGELVR
jgi:hypothetical protein